MRRFPVVITLLTAIAAFGLASPAFAQSFSVQILIDENGNGILTNTAGFFGALQFGLLNDPGPGGERGRGF